MWKFFEHIEGRTERDPHELEFFSQNGNWSDSLVRETLQNSLDAKAQNQKEELVIVRFTLKRIKNDKYDTYLEILKDHFESTFDVTNINNRKVLLIEDFGTTGLDGYGKKKEERGNYYDFWWREGKSTKKGTKQGRWGLGKTVFHCVSKYRSFWGYTKTKDEKDFLLGKALLKNHRYNKIQYDYCGFYADWKDKKEISSSGLIPFPIEDKPIINDFKRVFRLSRNNENGLSIVIPELIEDVNYEEIIRSVVKNYFYPIINGSLKIIVNDEENELYEDISSDNIKSQSKKINAKIGRIENTDFQIEFFRNAIKKKSENDCLEINGNSKDWSKILEEDKKEYLQDEFNNNELVAIKINTIIEKKQKKIPTHYYAFFKKDEELSKPNEFYIRSGILVNGDYNLRLKSPVQAALIAEDETISMFLGDSETPSHDKWNEKAEGFKEKYSRAIPSLRFIKNSLKELVKRLNKPPEGRDETILSDIFFSVDYKEGKGKKTKKPELELSKTHPDFLINPISNGGVNIKLRKKEKVQLPKTIEISFAYDVIRGNPFKKWTEFDFKFPGHFKFRGKGIKNNKFTPFDNKIKTTIINSKFEIQIKGFDPNRDVVVNIKDVKEK